MTKASRTRAPKFEAEINSSDIFKIVATIIVLLVVGAMGALYLGIMTLLAAKIATRTIHRIWPVRFHPLP